MLKKFEIRGVHAVIDDNLRKYVTKKIGRADKYMSRASRASAHLEVYLKEATVKDKSQSTCEVNLHLPHETINVKESTINMYAAVDIVEAKLRQQLRKYKDLHHGGKMQRRLFARFSRQNAQANVGGSL